MTIDKTKLATTFEYGQHHPKLASTRDAFFLLDGKQYDASFYRLVKLLQSFTSVTKEDLGLDDSANDKNAIVDKLHSCIQTAIAAPTTTLKQIKKLRYACYEFSLNNNIKVHELVKDCSAAIQDKKDKKHAKLLKEATAALKDAFKAKKSNRLIKNKWLHEIWSNFDNLPELTEENPNRLQLEIYLNDLQIKLLEKNDLTIEKLRLIKNHLQKFYFTYKLKENFSTIDSQIRQKLSENNNYVDLYEKIRNVLIALKNTPRKTGLRSKLPFAWNNSMDKDVFYIIKQLDNMWLNKQSSHLAHLFLELSVGNKSNPNDCKTHIERFLNLLYGTFNTISVQEDIKIEDLKKLKKLIHSFAEKNNFDKKIFNLRKSYQKRLDDEAISNKLLDMPKRKYAYIEAINNTVTEKKLRMRNRKAILDKISLAVTIIVALGEGILAAVLFGWLLVPALLIIGTAGFAVNYFLFRRDSFETLKQFFVTGIFKDANGNEVSNGKKLAINLTIFSALAVSIVFGVFTFNAAIVAISGLLALASIGFPPLAIGIAVLLAAVTIMANATMFYNMIADFIKNDRIKQIGNYFKTNFYDIWKHPKEWMDRDLDHPITKGEKAIHYTKASISFLFNGLFVLVGIAACAFVTAITLGFAQTQAIEFLDKFTSLAPRAAELASNIVVNVIAAPLNSFLYWRGMLKSIGMVKSFTKSVISAVVNIRSTVKSIKESIIALHNNPLRAVDVVINTGMQFVLDVMTLFNAAGQAGGPYDDPRATGNVESVINVVGKIGPGVAPEVAVLADEAAKGISGSIAGFGSAAINRLQTQTALALPNAVAFPNALSVPENSKDEIKSDDVPITVKPKKILVTQTAANFFNKLADENSIEHPNFPQEELEAVLKL